MLDLSYPTLYLPKVEVCISGEVLTDRGVDITQSTVKGGATHTDHYCDQTKQKEEQAGVSATDLCRGRQTQGVGGKINKSRLLICTKEAA